ncbi:MAG: thioredoxin [Firmicutes bacterium]|nr:thioredoxin [Bacillota bacterium]
MEKKFTGKVIFIKADLAVRENAVLANQYGIRLIPTFKFFDKKGNLVETKGIIEDSEFEGVLTKLSK